MKKGRHDPFPAELFRAEMDGVRMSADEKMRALSRMKGERQMVRRTGYVLALALLLLLLTAGGTLALSGVNHADKQEDVMLTLSQPSAVIPGKDGLGSCIFTLEDALYDGSCILISYRMDSMQYLCDVPADAASDAMPVEEAQPYFDTARKKIFEHMQNLMQGKHAQNVVLYQWEVENVYTTDGLNMERWYNKYHVSMGDMHYLWIKLFPVTWQEAREGDATAPEWFDRDEITVNLRFLLYEQMLSRDEQGNDMWNFAQNTDEYFVPITIARTDEIEKRTVADGVIRVDENTYFIQDSLDCNAAVLHFDDLSYDGSNINMAYSMAGDARCLVAPDKMEISAMERYEADEIWLDHFMNKLGTQVYESIELLGKDKALGRMWGIDVHALRDENGKELSGYADSTGMGVVYYDPIVDDPDGYRCQLPLRVIPYPRGVRPEWPQKQPLIDKEEITVQIPLTVDTEAYIVEDGVLKRARKSEENGVMIPVTIKRSENVDIGMRWESVCFSDKPYQAVILPDNPERNSRFFVASTKATQEEMVQDLFFYGADTLAREFNAVSDIAVKPLDEADDPYGYLARAKNFLDASIGVQSVLLRFASPGVPVLEDGTALEKFLNADVHYDESMNKYAWYYTWKENVDLSAFEGMDVLEATMPIMDTRVYAVIDENGRIFAGMESIPVPGDSLTVQLLLP